jgi:hypothetical protein
MNHPTALKFGVQCVLVALLIGFALSMRAQSARDVLDEYLPSQAADQRVPGLVFVQVDASGSADVRTYGEGITPETRFYIGSLNVVSATSWRGVKSLLYSSMPYSCTLKPSACSGISPAGIHSGCALAATRACHSSGL